MLNNSREILSIILQEHTCELICQQAKPFFHDRRLFSTILYTFNTPTKSRQLNLKTKVKLHIKVINTLKL